MDCNATAKVSQLESRNVLRLDNALGESVRVTRGTVWLTLAGDPRDIVLSAGDSFMIDRRGLTLVEAQEDATVCLQARAAGRAGAGSSQRGIAARLAAWLASTDPARFHRRSAPYY